jgi:hypothetical protein
VNSPDLSEPEPSLGSSSWLSRQRAAGLHNRTIWWQASHIKLSASPKGGWHDGLVKVRDVDPRDQAWELDEPSYRVYFHEPEGGSDEYEVSGADVVDVISWADAQRGVRTYVLYACVPRDGLGLVRLLGTDPNAQVRS